MEASLQELRQVVVLSSTYEARNRSTRQRAAARMQVVQQDSECFRIELYYWELEKDIVLLIYRDSWLETWMRDNW